MGIEVKNSKLKKKTILLTGASGHIGLTLSKLISKKENYELVALCRNKNDMLSQYVEKVIYCDVTNYDEFLKACEEIDYIIHLAAVHEKDVKSDLKKDEVLNTSIQGTKNLIEISKQKKFKKIIYVSSVAICGVTTDKTTLVENDKYTDKNSEKEPYIKAKYFSHNLVENAIQEGLPFLILMPSFTIGENDYKLTPPNQIIKKLCNFPFNLFYLKGGINIINVKDIAYLIYSSIKDLDIGEKYILSGYNIEIKDLILRLRKLNKNKLNNSYIFFIPKQILLIIFFLLNPLYSIMKKKLPLSLFQIRYRTNTYAYFDNKKVKQKIKFDLIDLDQTLKETIDWLSTHLK